MGSLNPTMPYGGGRGGQRVRSDGNVNYILGL